MKTKEKLESYPNLHHQNQMKLDSITIRAELNWLLFRNKGNQPTNKLKEGLILSLKSFLV